MRDPLASVSIRYKLPLTFLAICLVAFGVGGVVLTSEARTAIENEIEQRVDERATATALIVERHLDLHRRRVEDFASDGHIRGRFAALTRAAARGDDATVRRERAELVRHFEENKLSLVDAFVGAVLCGTDGAPIAWAPESSRPESVSVAATTVAALEPASAAHPYPTFRIATPLRSLVGNRQIGTLELMVRADVWVVGMNELEGLPPLPLETARIVADTGVSLPLAGIDGEEIGPGAYRRPLPGTAWTVVLDVDRALAMAPADRLRDQYIWIGIGLLLLTAGVLFFPVRFLLQPLSGIAEAARRIGDGDFEARVEHDSGDEIGDLANAFNLMADAVEDRTQRLKDAAGAIVHREQQIRLERDRLGAVIRSMEDGLFILDADGNVTLSNAAARPLVEVLSDEDTRRLECGRGPRRHPGCLLCLADTDRGQQTCVVEHGGRIYDIHTTTLPAAPGARPGRLCVSRDVTERIDLQERQAHQERLTVLGEIAAVMAHELNNPLAAISMFAQMLEDQLEDGSASSESAGVIRRNVDTCKQTIHGLLDLAARGHRESVPFDLHLLLEDVQTFLTPIADRAQVALELESGVTDATLLGDEVRLRQVFVNLVMNAIQACSEGGRVTLRTSDVERGIAVDVADTGAGIAEPLKARIFEPFFTTKGPGVGTGLGLSTSRRIVEEHGGALTLEASGRGGTRFRVALPRKAELRAWETEARLAADVASDPVRGGIEHTDG